MTKRPLSTRAMTAIRVALGLVVASTLLSSGGSAGAQDGTVPALGGYSGTAAASGLHALYAPEGLLPIAAPLDLGAPDALASIASGPATFARASVADPGDLLANPDALLALASSAYEAGTIPPYPFRIAASSGVGLPSAESAPAPGLYARVNAEGSTSSALATMPAVNAPAIATLGTMAAYADTNVEGSTVTVHARAEIDTVDILGLIRIESIVTDLTATSTGAETSFEGGTTVTGASILGQPITIDEEGIRGPLAGLALGDLLSDAGIQITLPGPVELAGANAGQRFSTGLRVDIEVSPRTLPVLDQLLDSLPPLPPLAPGAPSLEDVLAAARARHLVSIEIGRGQVTLTARPSFMRPPTPDASPSSPTVTPSAPVTPGASTGVPSVPGAPAPVANAPTAPVLTTEVPTVSVGEGIGALAILLLLLQPIVGDRLARVAAAQLATDEESCRWERP